MRKINRLGATLTELIVLMLVLMAAAIGFSNGAAIGGDYGTSAKIIGAVVGTLLGGFSALLACFVVALILEPFDRFWRWWRPYPPLCENGTCFGFNEYEIVKLADHSTEQPDGLSSHGRRCSCGIVYAGGIDSTFRNRWVRVLPTGKIRPYLVHSFMGRWRADNGCRIPVEMIELEPDNAR